MNLERQLNRLYDSLGEFGATDRAPSQLIDIFNLLLSEAKSAAGDHPVVAAIEPVPPHGLGLSIDCGGLRALTYQLLGALQR
jgi:hypothetical protein